MAKWGGRTPKQDAGDRKEIENRDGDIDPKVLAARQRATLAKMRPGGAQYLDIACPDYRCMRSRMHTRRQLAACYKTASKPVKKARAAWDAAKRQYERGLRTVRQVGDEGPEKAISVRCPDNWCQKKEYHTREQLTECYHAAGMGPEKGRAAWDLHETADTRRRKKNAIAAGTGNLRMSHREKAADRYYDEQTETTYRLAMEGMAARKAKRPMSRAEREAAELLDRYTDLERTRKDDAKIIRNWRKYDPEVVRAALERNGLRNLRTEGPAWTDDMNPDAKKITDMAYAGVKKQNIEYRRKEGMQFAGSLTANSTCWLGSRQMGNHRQDTVYLRMIPNRCNSRTCPACSTPVSTRQASLAAGRLMAAKRLIDMKAKTNPEEYMDGPPALAAMYCRVYPHKTADIQTADDMMEWADKATTELEAAGVKAIAVIPQAWPRENEAADGPLPYTPHLDIFGLAEGQTRGLRSGLKTYGILHMQGTTQRQGVLRQNMVASAVLAPKMTGANNRTKDLVWYYGEARKSNFAARTIQINRSDRNIMAKDLMQGTRQETHGHVSRKTTA